MLIYLDTVIVIYFVEGPTPFSTRAQTHLANLRLAGDHLVVSDLTRLECRVKPLRLGDTSLLADSENFLTAADIVREQLPSPVYEQAAEIRALHHFKLGDSLHLAAAVEARCDRFLTNDRRLARFPDIPVEVLP